MIVLASGIAAIGIEVYLIDGYYDRRTTESIAHVKKIVDKHKSRLDEINEAAEKRTQEFYKMLNQEPGKLNLEANIGLGSDLPLPIPLVIPIPPHEKGTYPPIEIPPYQGEQTFHPLKGG